MSPRTKLVIGFSTLLMVRMLTGCDEDTTIAVANGSGGGGGTQGPSGSGGAVSGSGGRVGVDGGPDAEVGGELDGNADLQGSVDAEVGTSTCCPRSPGVSGCMQLGGSSDQSSGCTVICDFFCSENWHVVKDQHGCEAWTYSLRQPAAGEDFLCRAKDAGADLNGIEASQDTKDAGTDGDASEDI